MQDRDEPDEFIEANHTPVEIATHWNACGYTPDHVPVNAVKLADGRWVVGAEFPVYWTGNNWAANPK